MAREATGGELTNFRKDGQRSTLKLSILMPEVVATCRLNAVPTDNDKANNIDIKTWAWGGGYSLEPKDLLMYIGTSAGAFDKGMCRLRQVITGTPTDLDIGETSEISWAEDDYITIVNEINLHPRHLFINDSSVVFMDYDIAYTDQHDDKDPVPIMGPTLFPVDLPTGGTIATLWDASDSWVIGAAVTTYTWAAPGASATAGLDTATPTITYNAAGVYRVACTVLADNGKSYVGTRWVKVHSQGSPPITDFILESCTGNFDSGGWSARVILHDDATLTDIRDRALCAIYADDWYGTTTDSIGPIDDREDTIFVGWVSGESIEWDPEEGTVSFDIQGPQFWLQNMNGFPSGVESVSGAAAAWTDFPTLTTRGGLWHFMHWRTTCTRILDVTLTEDTREISLFNASPGTLWEQLLSEADATIFAKPICDRYGRLFVLIEPNLIPVGDRGSIPTVQAITTNDLRRPVTIERNPVKRVGLVDLSGIFYDVAADAAAAYFSLAPGHVHAWHGAAVERYERLALASQGQSNTLSGLMFGWRNNVYPTVSLPLASNQRLLDITPHQYVTIDIVSGDTERGIQGTLTLIPRTVSFVHDLASGTLLTDLQAEGVTDDTGSPNMNGDPPEIPPEGTDPDPPPEDWDPVPETDPGWPDTCIYPTRLGGVWYSIDFTGAESAVMPTWTQIATGGVWPGDDELYDFGCDPDDPFNNMYAVTETSKDVIKFNGTTWIDIIPAATYQDSGDPLYAGHATATVKSIWVDQQTDTLWVYITLRGISPASDAVYKSENNGSSFSIMRMTQGTFYRNGGNMMAFGDRVAYCGCYGSTAWTGYFSINGGATWTVLDNVGISTAEQRLYIPMYTDIFLRRGYAAAAAGTVLSDDWAETATETQSDLIWGRDEAEHPLRMWGDPGDITHFRVLDDGGTLITTTSTFTSYTTRGVLQIPGYNDGSNPVDVAGMAYKVAEEYDTDRIVYFSRDPNEYYPHCIFVADGEADITPEVKSGDDPITPDGSSIPYTAGGSCFGGPWLFFSDDISLP